MFQNGQNVCFLSGGDAARIQKVQIATGRDLARYPRVIPTNTRSDKQVQVVPGGDEARFPVINPLPVAPAAWFQFNKGITVTGSGVSQWDDQSGNARHLLQGTDANRPIGLLHTGTNYLYSPNVAANNASTPDSVPGSIAGDETIVMRVNQLSNAGIQYWFSNYNGATAGSVVYTNASSVLNYVSGGTNAINVASSAAQPYGVGVWFWLKVTCDVDNGAAGSTVKFYTAADQATVPTSWAQLGTDKTTAGVHVRADSASVRSVLGNSGIAFSGYCSRAFLQNGIDGTTVVDFNAADATDQAASFVSSTTGETWTVNSTGVTPSQIVASTRLMGNGTAHKMAAAYTANQPVTRFVLGYAISWTAGDYLISGATGECGITQVTGTPTIGLNAGAAAASNAGMTLGAWKVLTAVINGASSSLTVNSGTPATGDAGANNSGGITLFSNAAGAGFFNGMVKEIIDFQGVMSATNIARVQKYLMGVGGI